MIPLLQLFAGPAIALSLFALCGGASLPGALAVAVGGQLVSYPVVRGLMRRRMLEVLRRIRAERRAGAGRIAGHVTRAIVIRERFSLGARVAQFALHTLLTLAFAGAFSWAVL